MQTLNNPLLAAIALGLFIWLAVHANTQASYDSAALAKLSDQALAENTTANAKMVQLWGSAYEK